MLSTCQNGYEGWLARELAQQGLAVQATGPGWVLSQDTGGPLPTELAFAHTLYPDTKELVADSVNGLANALLQYFLESLKGEKVEHPWPCHFEGPSEMPGLGRRLGAVDKTFREQLKRRLSRVAKLATEASVPNFVRTRGLFVFFTDFGRLQVGREALRTGARRMADDEAAPSRSYLKVEEAYGLLGREPTTGQTVIDLGAAPGGWTYSAAKRGALVEAIDNGPLKGGALGHPLVHHRREDAFRVTLEAGRSYQWLFCDLVEEPHHVLRNLVEPWLSQGWCETFVINLKFGRVDPLALLAELRREDSPLVRYSQWFRLRHLFHDREEFTLVGETRRKP